MKFLLLISIIWCCCLAACRQKNSEANTTIAIANGQIPNLSKDENGTVHLSFGSGDSLLYSFSSDEGKSFSTPALVDTLAGLFSFAMRGPQITTAGNGVCIIACTKEGDIFSYVRTSTGKWEKPVRVNDTDTIAKEGFLALGSDGRNHLFAAWLDLRNKRQNNIYGARSTDGGKTWSKNSLVYRSPDAHTCECCKPSVAVSNGAIYVMFRNWLDGNRDLYLARSYDSGMTFSADRLGTNHWKLDGCPMDGGGLAVGKNGSIQTVWRRDKKIYTNKPGKQETEIGEGKHCTIEMINSEPVYAWVENAEVVVLLPGGKKQHLGKGSLPVLKTMNSEQLLCIWENDKQIFRKVITL